MNCLNCNKETNNLKFCSRRCAAFQTRNGAKHHGKPKGNCAFCNTLLSKSNKKFCDNKCQRDYELNELINSGEFSSKTAKRALLKQNASCSCCGLYEWLSKLITLELDYIDGNSENNKLDNLRLLCPNCHSQTSTYKAKNRGNGRHFRRVRYAEGKSF